MNKLLKKYIDKFTIFLLVFAILLSSLFYYLTTISSNLQHHDDYSHKLDEMLVLDYRMENFFLKTFRYMDNDEINSIVNKFDQNIIYLKNKNINREFKNYIYKDIKKLEETFREKVTLMEYFKTSNARVTNSMHYLYDLRTSIDKTHLNNIEVQESLNNFFFIAGQSLMDIPFDIEKLALDIDMFKKYSKNNNLFKYFDMQSKLFLKDYNQIKTYIENKNKLKLHNLIVKIMDKIDKHYIEKRNEYSNIAFIFFILAFTFLVVLLLTYYKVQKTTRELLAFRYAIENSDNIVVITDTNRNIEYVNDAFEKHTGYNKDDVVGKNPNILKSGVVSPDIYRDLNKTLDAGQKWQGELINRHKDGTLMYEKVSIVPIFLDDKLIQYLAIKLDVTDYIKLQNSLQQSAIVYEMSGDAIVVTDKDKNILSVNSAFVDMFGYSRDEIIDCKISTISTIDEDSLLYKTMWAQLIKNNKWSGKMINQTKKGVSIPTWLTVSVVRDKKGEILNFIAIYTNLQDIIDMEERVEHLAYHDTLTTLPNRAGFENYIYDAIELAKLLNHRVAVLFIDLDRFKVINDTLGHDIGDKMLIELSKRIGKIVKKKDMLARIGGDEFVVVTNEAYSNEEVEKLANDILFTIREAIEVNDYYLYTTASIGIAFYPDDGKEKNELIKHADSAMYHAKDMGKDNYQFYTKQLSIDVEERLNLEQELLQALDRDELKVYYQPQYNIETNKVSGAEALLRWHSKNLGWISPEEFIPIAEDTGIIVSIGYFVFERACRDYMRWQKLGLDLGNISINISSIQFREDDMLNRIKNIIKKVDIPADKIEIEITENFIMEYSTTNLTILEDLRSLGCSISIDDFGTGYSSMSYMKSLSLDSIKIDKSFIMDLPNSTHDAEVSKAIIALSKSLGYKVIAEGIETKEQENFLKKYKCDIGQGYFFSQPLSREEFEVFIKDNS